MIPNLSGQLLLATPSMNDHFFQDSVVLLCHHDDEGSMGLVLNHTQDISVFDVLDDMDLCHEQRKRGIAQMRFEEQVVFEAGPLDTYRGFVLHDTNTIYDSTMCVGEDLYLTTSKDILEDLAAGGGPQRFLLLLGYAAWEAGQLENELIANDWLLAQPSHTLIFNTPCEHRWALGARSLGFERSQLSSQVGHA